jgi:hypothetical protein
MGRTACTEPQCLYKDALYLTYISIYMSVQYDHRVLISLGYRYGRILNLKIPYVKNV